MKTCETIIRLTEVQRITGLSRASIYLHVSKGIFPRQIKIGPRASGWLRSDIQAWIDGRIAAARK